MLTSSRSALRIREMFGLTLLGIFAGAVVLVPAPLWLALAVSGLVALAGFVMWLLASPSRWVLSLIASVLVLPPLPLPWGDSGVHPSIIIVAIGLVLGVAQMKSWRMLPSPVGIALALLAVALLLSLPWAVFYSGLTVAAGSVARVGLFCISLYVFHYIANGPGRNIGAEQFIRVLLWAGLASVSFAVVDFVLQLPTPSRYAEQFVWLNSGVYRRAQGVFYESSTLASFCSLLLITIGAMKMLGASRQLRIPSIFVWLCAISALMALVCSFSRTAVLSATVSGLALLSLHIARVKLSGQGFKGVAAVGLSVLAGVGILYAAFPEFLRAYSIKLQHSAEFFFSEPNSVLSRRLDSWFLLGSYLSDYPWQSILGIGYKTLPYTEYLGEPVIADNMYLSLVIEAGWSGLAALLLLNIAILHTAYVRARSSDRLVSLCATIAFCFWCGEIVQMATGDVLTYWRILPVVFGLLAFVARDEDPLSRSV